MAPTLMRSPSGLRPSHASDFQMIASGGIAGKVNPNGRARISVVAGLALAVYLLAFSVAFFITTVRDYLLVYQPSFTTRLGLGVGTDFPAFYVVAVETRAGRASEMYDPDRFQAAHERVRGVPVYRYNWAYPPTFFLFLWPLSLLPLVPALWTWLGVTVGALMAGAYALAPHRGTPLVVLLFPGVVASFGAGPSGTFLAAIVTAAMATLQSSPLVAGMLFGLVSVKPHLAALIPCCLLAARAWVALAGFVLSSIGLVLASLIAVGMAPWHAFAHAIIEHAGLLQVEHFPWVRMPTMHVAVLHATNDPSLAAGAQIVTTAAVLAACMWVWHRTDDLATRSLALAASLPLVGPYAYDYDVSPLIVPIVCTAWEAYRRRHISTPLVLLLVWMWLTPRAIWLISPMVGQQVGPLLLVPLLAVAVARTFRQSPVRQ